MAKRFTPDRGHLVWLNFTPQKGREQAGKRPAIVLSPLSYNRKVGLAICCPITKQIKGYPFEVVLPAKCRVQGAILSDHVKNLDWKARSAKLIERAPAKVVEEVTLKLHTLLQLSD